MKVNFTATTKRTAMPKGITLKIEGQAEVPKGMSRADLIKELKEYASSQMKVRNKYCLSPECINIALG
jgi:hypothetical protein